jgi:acyl carrier protein
MLPFFYFYNMDILEFINVFKESFDELDEVISPQTKFKELEAWTSMQALLFIVHIDDTLNFVYNAEDIANSTSIEDLFLIYINRK